MGTKFSIIGDAVNVHASNLDSSVTALNSQARSFLTAIEPLPGASVRTGVSTPHPVCCGPPTRSKPSG
jgi:hypothetical protein